VLRQTQPGGPPRQTLLLGVGADPQQAALARAEGADLIDVRGATPGALAAIRASLPAGVLWTDPRADPLDADKLAAAAEGQSGAVHRGGAAGPASRATPAAVIATAAVCTWLGAPIVRSRDTRAVRRAIDMTASITGRRPPAHTVRGLA
jgi:dihydropteroate synthase